MISTRLKVLSATALAAGVLAAGLAATAAPTEKTPVLQSAGPLAFAPNGVLLIGDTAAATVVAVGTGDTKKGGPGKVEVADLTGKIAAMLGAKKDEVAVNDVAVNPVSGSAYISVSRGLGPDAKPVILKADRSGALTEVKVDSLKHTSVSLLDAPAPDAKDARGNAMRTSSITDLGYVNGQVLVAGLSNEEFSSSMRSISYPFKVATKGASIEMYHASHGRFETAAPVRTFMTYDIKGHANVLAAYTCTPLVKIPVDQFKPGAKIKATTIAELGNMNRPIDMIGYQQKGHPYILMANQQRGVMKIDAADIDNYGAIESHMEAHSGVPYVTINSLKGVTHLSKVDDTSAVIVVADAGDTSLKTIALP
ncbi:MAG: hypothetical protein ABI740_06200 [Alphaproteobacteria bacterium]